MSRPHEHRVGAGEYRSRIENRRRITLASLHLAEQSKVMCATFGNLKGQKSNVSPPQLLMRDELEYRCGLFVMGTEIPEVSAFRVCVQSSASERRKKDIVVGLKSK